MFMAHIASDCLNSIIINALKSEGHMDMINLITPIYEDLNNRRILWKNQERTL